MKTKNIIVKLKSSDTTQFAVPMGDNNLMIQLDQTDVNKMVSANLLRDLESFKLVPNNTIYDLVNLALGVYTIDQVVSRQSNGFQGWSRHLVVNFPVHDLQLWNNVSNDFATYLSFLSGDKWEIAFRQNHETRKFELPEDRNPGNFTKVSLFSGGLDSFIGAIDLLSNREKPFFVSHYKTSEKKVQDDLINGLKDK